MKIKVLFDCSENDYKIYTLEEFVISFNAEEINSATDLIELVEE